MIALNSVKRGSYGVASALILICLLIATELAKNRSMYVLVLSSFWVFAKKIQFLNPWLRKYLFCIHTPLFSGCRRQAELYADHGLKWETILSKKTKSGELDFSHFYLIRSP